MKSGKQVQFLGSELHATSVAFSPDGRTIAASGVMDTGWPGARIFLWDVETGAELAQITAHKPKPASVAFSPDGKIFASGGHDSTVRLWGMTAHKELTRLDEHESHVMSVVFSPDSRYLASGSADTTILIWDVARLLDQR